MLVNASNLSALKDPSGAVASALVLYIANLNLARSLRDSDVRSDVEQDFPGNVQINMSEPTVTIRKHRNAYWTRELSLTWPLCPFADDPSRAESALYGRLSFLSMGKQILDEMFSTGLAFQVKMHIVWCIDIPSRDEYDLTYPMAFVPMSISPLTLSFNSSYTMGDFIREVRNRARAKVEDAEGLPSGVIFKSILQIRLLTLPEPALLSMAPSGPPIPLGGAYVQLPRALRDKRACVNIKNTDNCCFKYCLVCWKLQYHKQTNPDRWPGRYAIESVNRSSGRPRKGATCTFTDAGMDFSMLPHNRAPNYEEIAEFEHKNSIGVYIFDWHFVQVESISTDWARPIRAPARAYEQEVLLLLHSGHFCLITNFQAFVSRQHSSIRTIKVPTMHTCHRCMQNFDSAGNLHKHLEDRNCHRGLLKDSKTKLCLPGLAGKNRDEVPTKRFTGEHKKVVHPLVVYADFETFFEQEHRVATAKLTITGNNNRVASASYHAVGSDGFEVPTNHLLWLSREEHAAERMIISLLKLASHYHAVAKHPKEINMSSSDESSFQAATHCYTCQRPFTQKHSKVRDHNHFTGQFRGAACDRCNKEMKYPRCLPVYFHNLKGFDGHLIIKAIQRLKNKEFEWTDEVVEAFSSSDSDDDNGSDPEAEGDTRSAPCINRKLLSWMRTEGQQKYLEGNEARRVETWGIAMRSVKSHSQQLDEHSNFKDIHGIGPVIARILQSAPWNSFVEQCSDQQSKGQQADICEKIGKLRFEVIAKTNESFPMIRLGPLQFLDTTNFLKCSLDSLIQSQRKTQGDLSLAFPRMRSLHPQASDDTMELLLQKIPMPFRVMNDPSCWLLPALLPRDSYFSDLTGEECSEETYSLIAKVIDTLGLGDFAAYHDVYLCTDVLALADCFQAFRSAFHQEHGLDVAHFISMPSASMSAMLLKTGARLELICESNGGWDFMNDVNANIRGGLSCVFQPHVVANNPEMGDEYRPDLPTSWISYVDVNSLYPTVMCQSLPYRNYQAVQLPDEPQARLDFIHETLHAYSDLDQIGFMFVVTLEVPESVHDELDFAPVASRRTSFDELSALQQERQAIFQSSTGDPKLMPYLGRQESVGVHAALLKFYVEVMHVRILDVHRGWQWEQAGWMSGFIEGIAAKRSQASDKNVKETLKLTMNALYGMMLQNKEKYSNTSIYASHDAFVRAATHTRASDWDIADMGDDGFIGTVSTPKAKGVVLDTPRLVGFSILELSKLHMYKVHYLHFKPLYGPRLKLLMMDTDSFIQLIETDDVIHDMKITNENTDAAARFDLSTRSSIGQCANQGQLGCLKYEAGDDVICEYMGLQSKMYCLRMGSGSAEKKGKGIPKKCVQKLTFDLYRCQLQDPKMQTVQFNRIQSKRHKLEHVQQSKKGLASFNDKVFQVDCMNSVPLGHYSCTKQA